jgi:hypothetical protein
MLENRLHRKLDTTPEELQKNKENPPRRLDLTVPSHGSDDCDDRNPVKEKSK